MLLLKVTTTAQHLTLAHCSTFQTELVQYYYTIIMPVYTARLPYFHLL